jgi:repressor LexA
MFARQTNSTDSTSIQVPLLGHIPAGPPAVAHEDIEEMLPLPAHFFRGDRLFAVRVRGSSMTGAGILDGDIAVFDATSSVPDGAIAAVLVEDDATLKRIFRRRNEILLKAENPTFPDIKVRRTDGQHVEILGLLIGILRKV